MQGQADLRMYLKLIHDNDSNNDISHNITIYFSDLTVFGWINMRVYKL